jgi:hypothetical protein
MTTIYEIDDIDEEQEYINGLRLVTKNIDDLRYHIEDLANRCDRRADEVRGTKSRVTALEWTDLADRLREAVE